MKLKVIHRYRVDDEDCEGDCKSVVIKNKNKIIAEYGDHYCDPCDKADRSFYYEIIDQMTGLVIFIGRVVKP